MYEKFIKLAQKVEKYHTCYDLHAYFFMEFAVEYTSRKNHLKQSHATNQHISGEELINGFLELVVKVYEELAPLALEYWGVKSGRDVGVIVYDLIESKILSASQDDSLSDFDCVGELISKMDEEKMIEINRTPDQRKYIKFPIID